MGTDVEIILMCIFAVLAGGFVHHILNKYF